MKLPPDGPQMRNAIEVALTKLETAPPGWAQATGTATRTTFDTATVTLPQLAERVKAILDDLVLKAKS
jgi:hypothetical protein